MGALGLQAHLPGFSHVLLSAITLVGPWDPHGVFSCWCSEWPARPCTCSCVSSCQGLILVDQVDGEPPAASLAKGLRKIPYQNFLRGLDMNKLDFFQNLFAYWDDHVVLVFNFVSVGNHIYWFAYIEPALQILLGCGALTFRCAAGFNLLVFCWGYLLLYSWRILVWNFLSHVVCQILVLGWRWLHWMRQLADTPPQFFGTVSEGLLQILLCSPGRIHLWIHLVLGFFFLLVVFHFNYWFNFRALYWSIQGFNTFLI